ELLAEHAFAAPLILVRLAVLHGFEPAHISQVLPQLHEPGPRQHPRMVKHGVPAFHIAVVDLERRLLVPATEIERVPIVGNRSTKAAVALDERLVDYRVVLEDQKLVDVVLDGPLYLAQVRLIAGPRLARESQPFGLLGCSLWRERDRALYRAYLG